MIELHLAKLRRREIVSVTEETAIRGTVSRVERFPANSLIAEGGKETDRCTLVLDGWLARSIEPRGHERQITGISIPGDLADFHGLALRRLDHHVTALTDCTVAFIPHAELERLCERHAHIARVYRLMSSIESSIERQWAASLGRRSRAAHLAHFFCEMFLRLEAVGLATGTSFEFPLTQYQIADCLGATPVHVNRVLQELRASGSIKLEHRRLTILDWGALEALARFEPDYLFIEQVSPVSATIVQSNAGTLHERSRLPVQAAPDLVLRS